METNSITYANIAPIVISIIAVSVVVFRDVIKEKIFRPRLEVKFTLEKPTSRETTVMLPGRPHSFWPRLRVENVGRSVARGCEAVLAEVTNAKGELDTRYDPLTLRWAIAPIERGLSPLDIAPHRVVYLNTFYTIEQMQDAPFATHSDPRGVLLGLSPGDYWLRIVIYGDNLKPTECGYAVQWDGTDYLRGVKMQDMNNRPSNKTKWPWPLTTK